MYLVGHSRIMILGGNFYAMAIVDDFLGLHGRYFEQQKMILIMLTKDLLRS